MKKAVVIFMSMILLCSSVCFADPKPNKEGYDPTIERTIVFGSSYILPEYMVVEEGTTTKYESTYLTDEEGVAFLFDYESLDWSMEKIKEQVPSIVVQKGGNNGYLICVNDIETDEGVPGIEIISHFESQKGDPAISIFSAFKNEENGMLTMVAIYQLDKSEHNYIEDYRSFIKSMIFE